MEPDVNNDIDLHHFSAGLMGTSTFFNFNRVSRHKGLSGSKTPIKNQMSVGAFDKVVKPSWETTMCFSEPRIFDDMQKASTLQQ